jgi:MFS family permease
MYSSAVVPGGVRRPTAAREPAGSGAQSPVRARFLGAGGGTVALRRDWRADRPRRTPIRGLEHALAGQAGAVKDVFRNGELRRLELAWGGFFVVEWASLLAVSVWAYREGGASAVGLVGLLRMLPAAIALPFGAAVADRFPRHRVLVVVYVAQAVLIAGVAAVIQADGPPAVTYLLIAAVGVAAAPCRPAQLALAPMLARSAEELIAANVTQMTFEGLATLLGPALAGLVLAVSGPPAALGVAAGFSLASALLLTGVRAPVDPTLAARREREPVLRSLSGGLRELARVPDLAAMIGGFWVQTFVRGMLNVLVVSLTLTTLGLGEGAVGFISGTFGAGVILGALGATSMVGMRRLSRPIVLALVLWGLPLVVIALRPALAIVVAAFVLSGIGNAILDVAGFTQMQRVADDRVLGRVFGVFYVGILASTGIGSIVAPGLIDLVGIRGALAVGGALLPAAALVIYPRLKRVDDHASVPESALAAISAVPLFQPLPPTSLEKLARSAVTESVPAGTAVVVQGDAGDSFYVVVSGSLVVSADGRLLPGLGPGDFFGEIALLRDVPRTATVSASENSSLLAIRRMDFLSAVLGNVDSARSVEEIVAFRTGSGRSVPADAVGQT